jgi:hypothetical protein
MTFDVIHKSPQQHPNQMPLSFKPSCAGSRGVRGEVEQSNLDDGENFFEPK